MFFVLDYQKLFSNWLYTVSSGVIDKESREFNCWRGVKFWSIDESRGEDVSAAVWEVVKLSCELVGLDGKRGDERICELLVELDAVDWRRSTSALKLEPLGKFPTRGGIGGAFSIDREDSRSKFVVWVKFGDGRGVDCWLFETVVVKFELNCAAAVFPMLRRFCAICIAERGGGEQALDVAFPPVCWRFWWIELSDCTTTTCDLRTRCQAI